LEFFLGLEFVKKIPHLEEYLNKEKEETKNENI
jgi:hypothetical protein